MLVVSAESSSTDAPAKPSSTTGMASTYSTTSFISGAWIFLPRYSGVRPTIRPAMNTDRMAMISSPLRPTPTPPGLTSPSIMCARGTPPPRGVKLSCMELTDPLDVPVVDAAHRPEAEGRSEPPCPPCCRRPGRSRPPDPRRTGRARSCHWSRSPWPPTHDKPDDRHDGENRTPLPAVLHHVPVGEGQSERDDDDGVRLEEVVERGAVLERVRRVGVEEATAVGAELLDRLAGNGATGDHLRAALDGGDLGEAVEVLDHALADQDQGEHEARRQQDPRGVRVRSTQKLPSVEPAGGPGPRTNAAKTAMPAAAETNSGRQPTSG